jgi:hypothetical protein
VPGGVIAGIVIDPDGHPLPGATITARHLPEGTSWSDVPEDDAPSHQTATGPDGVFRLEGLEHEAWVLRPALEGHLVEEESDLRPAMTGDTDVSIVLCPLPPRASVAGLVVDEAGEPVPGVTVTELIQRRRTTTSAEGTFTLEGLRQGPARLRAGDLLFGAASARLQLEPGEARTGVILTLVSGPGIGGVVVDDAGSPVAGASVKAQREGTWGPPAWGRLTTEADGSFFLCGLEMARFTIIARREGPFQEVSAPCEIGQHDLRLVLPRGARVTGTVLGPDGQPAGARLALELRDDPDGVPRAATRYTREGPFELRLVPAGILEIVASSDEHLDSDPLVVELDGQTPVEGLVLRLLPGGTIAGVVVDTTGAPWPGASVRAVADPGEGEAILWWGDQGREAQCGETGAFELVGLDPGVTYCLRASDDDGFTVGGGSPARGRVGDPGLRLVLARGCELLGQILDTAGDPVPAASLELLPASAAPAPDDLEPLEWSTYDEGWTEEDGSFHLEEIPPGTWELHCSSRTHLPAPPVHLELAPGERREGLLIRLSEGGTITGEVLVPPGEHAEGVRVFWEEQGEGGPRSGSTVVGADGGFRITGLSAESCEVRAHRSGLLRAPGEPRVRRARVGEHLVLRLARPGTIRGRVVAEPPGSLEQFEVRLVRVEADGEEGLSWSDTFQDPEGAFEVRLRRLPDAGVTLAGVLVTAPGYLPVRRTPGALDPLGHHDVGTITLVRGGAFEVRVVSPDGAPLPGARVGVRPVRQERRGPEDLRLQPEVELTGEPGLFVAAPVTSGLYRVSARHEGLVSVSREVLVLGPGQPPGVTLTLAPGGVITGRVLGPGGTPQGGVLVYPGSTEADASGRFCIEGLPAAVHRVYAWVSGCEPDADHTIYLERVVDLRRRRTATCDLAVDPAGSLQCRVRGLRPRPGVRCNVRAEGKGPDGLKALCCPEVGPDGVAEVASLPVGTYELEVSWSTERWSGTLATATAGIVAGRTCEIELTVKGAGIRGHLRLPGGARLEPWMQPGFYLAPAGQVWPTKWPAELDLATGAFLLDHVEPGVHALEVHVPEVGRVRVDGLEVPADGVLDGVELVLVSGEALEVSVVDPAGLPPAGAWIHCRDLEGRAQDDLGVGATATGRGRWRIGPLLPGRYVLHAGSRQLALERVEAEVRPGTRNEVQVTLRDAGSYLTVRGTRAGEPLEDFQVAVGTAEDDALPIGGRYWLLSGLSNTVDCGRLPPGTYQVQVHAGGGVTATVPVTIPDGGEEVTLELDVP